MYNELYQYLILYKQLALPGIGTFILERKPAAADFPSRKINPPVYTIQLQSTVSSSSKKLFDWLASVLKVSDYDAIVEFNDFVFDLKRKLSSGDIVKWERIGELHKAMGGEIKFTPLVPQLNFEQPIKSEKIIREKPEHMVREGEDQKTAAEMTIILNRSNRRYHWWVYALVAGLLTLLFIVWYFSVHGMNISSMGNAKKINFQQPSATYKILR